MRRARVLLVDRSDEFLDGVEDWIAHPARLEIAGRAHTGEDALEKARSLEPEVVLIDVSLPRIDGFEVARRLKAQPGAPLVVLLSTRDTHAARLEPLVPLEIRGRREPVQAFRLLEIVPVPPAFQRRLDAPLVGRKRELAALRRGPPAAEAGPA